MQKTGEIRQLQFLDKVDDTRCVQRQMPGGSECRKLRRSRSYSTPDKGADVPVGAVHRRGPDCEKTTEISQFSVGAVFSAGAFFVLGHLADFLSPRSPRVLGDRGLWGWR